MRKFLPIFILILCAIPAGHAGPWWSSGPTVSTTALPPGKTGVPYAFAWAANGGKPPYTWAATSALPAGISLPQSGTMSGTPTAAGIFSVTAQVTDSKQKRASKTLALTITLSSPVPTPLVVQTITIPNGSVGQPFSFQIQITGGTPPYNCTVGPLSNIAEFGLSLSPGCLLFGIPTKAGNVKLDLD